MTQKILIPDRVADPDIEREELGDSFEFITPCATETSEVPEEHWSQADAILVWHDVEITKDVISKLTNCKVIVRIGVGLDSVDIDAATDRGIPVCNVPDYGTTDVADHAIALYLSLSRGIKAYEVDVSDGKWSWEQGPKLQRIAGSAFGVIGLGRIGSAVAMRAKAFDLDVHFFDPYRAEGWDKSLGLIRHDSIESLLASVDAVSLHVPLTSETSGMVDASFVAAMRPDSLLICTARGGILNLDEIDKGLRSGHIRGFGTDVLPSEPPDFQHPLMRDWQAGTPGLAERIIVTPHAAFFCDEAYTEMRQKAAREAARVLNGEKPKNCVNGLTF